MFTQVKFNHTKSKANGEQFTDLWKFVGDMKRLSVLMVCINVLLYSLPYELYKLLDTDHIVDVMLVYI